MDLVQSLALGFGQALAPANFVWCFVGVLIGTLVGVLPGLGPAATIAMLLPFTYGLSPVAAMIMLAGIYYGAQYGGSTTAILINLPGEASSVVTAIDGYKMARQGRAGTALATSAISSFVAGTIATILLALFAPALAEVGLLFGPAEYFALMTLGLVASILLASGSMMKGVAMALAGILLGLIGQDVQTALPRFTFRISELEDGIGFVVVAMGLFGIGEIIRDLENPEKRIAITQAVTGLVPSRADLIRMIAPTARGTIIGSVLGILPGGGALLASFAAYSIEKKIARPPEGMGNGAIEGVAAPESANNAGAQTSFVPMLTLGIPSNAVMALMIGALIVQGVAPGPTLVTEKPEIFWGVIASMWIGNAMLVVLNLPLIGIWVRLLAVPFAYLYPAILLFCAIGAFSMSNSTFDIWLLALFGALGYLFAKLECEPSPLILGLVLGPMMEENFRRAIQLSKGDYWTFLQRPLSATLLACAALALLVVVLPSIRSARAGAFTSNG